MNIEWRPVQSEEINLLQSPDSLYLFDLRGPNVTPWLKIDDFWKYENIFPWILKDKHVAVNEDYQRLTYPHTNKYMVAPKAIDSRISLIERIPSDTLESFSALWLGVPHRAADLLADRYGLQLNFSFVDFKAYNDKYTQKELFSDLTPDWNKVHSPSDIESKDSEWFLKRRHGSGGWQVFDLGSVTSEDINRTFSRGTDWFIEKKIHGEVYSIQCVRLPKENKTIVFGFVNQLIEDGTHFVGGRILPLSEMQSLIQEQLEQAINKLDGLLKNYEGFYGIDFIVTNIQKLYVLEANVRMTAMTIPVLVTNDLKRHFNFLEDVETNKVTKSEIVIAEDLVRKTADVLRASSERS